MAEHFSRELRSFVAIGVLCTAAYAALYTLMRDASLSTQLANAAALAATIGLNFGANMVTRQGYAEPFFQSNVVAGDPLGRKTVLLVSQVDDFRLPSVTSLLIKVVLLLFVGALALLFFRDRLSQAIEALAVWLVIALVLAVGYTYRFELQAVAERVVGPYPGRDAFRPYERCRLERRRGTRAPAEPP